MISIMKESEVWLNELNNEVQSVNETLNEDVSGDNITVKTANIKLSENVT